MLQLFYVAHNNAIGSSMTGMYMYLIYTCSDKALLVVWSHLRALLPVKMVSNIKGKVPHQAISIVLPLLYDCAWSVTGENLACYIHM